MLHVILFKNLLSSLLSKMGMLKVHKTITFPDVLYDYNIQSSYPEWRNTNYMYLETKC